MRTKCDATFMYLLYSIICVSNSGSSLNSNFASGHSPTWIFPLAAAFMAFLILPSSCILTLKCQLMLAQSIFQKSRYFRFLVFMSMPVCVVSILIWIFTVSWIIPGAPSNQTSQGLAPNPNHLNNLGSDGSGPHSGEELNWTSNLEAE